MNNRIDRIDGNKYYEYTKIKNLNISDADEKFSLDYKQNELAPETKESKDDKSDKTVSGQEADGTAGQNGVRLEISQNGRLAGADYHRQAAQAKKAIGTAMLPTALLESVREFITTAITTVKDFFYKIWNDSPQPEDASVKGTAPAQGKQQLSESDMDITISAAAKESGQDAEASYRMNEQQLDKEIQPYLRSGDLDQVINLLTDNGRRISARNSTLLTYYDRNGRMIEPSASDRERILHGDRNTRKL